MMSASEETTKAREKPYNLRERKKKSEVTEKGKSINSASGYTQQTVGLHKECAATSGNREYAIVHVNSPARPDATPSITLLESNGNTDIESDSNMADTVSHSEFVKTTGLIMTKLDNLNANVTATRKEISEIRDAVADSCARLTAIENESIPQLKQKTSKLERELNDKILQLEIHDRKMNLLIYGVQSKREENVINEVRNIIKDLGFSDAQTQNIFISNAHRLPRRAVPVATEQGGGRGPDPIIVRFGAMIDRDSVLQAYQRMNTTRNRTDTRRPKYRIVTDLPAPLKQKRFMLEQKAYQLRKNENKSTRIKLIGVNLHLEARERGSSSGWKAVQP